MIMEDFCENTIFQNIRSKKYQSKIPTIISHRFFLLYLLLRRERYYLRARDEMIMVYYWFVK